MNSQRTIVDEKGESVRHRCEHAEKGCRHPESPCDLRIPHEHCEGTPCVLRCRNHHRREGEEPKRVRCVAATKEDVRKWEESNKQRKNER